MKRACGVCVASVAVFFAAGVADSTETAALFRSAQDHAVNGHTLHQPRNGVEAPCGSRQNGTSHPETDIGWSYLGGGSTQALLEDGTAVQRLRRPPRQYVEIVTELATEYDLDPRLVIAVMAVESGFHRRAVSPKGAQGLMQLIPATAARFGVGDPFNARHNITGGMKYLRWLLDHFSGGLPLALAAYNAGENAVIAHGGIPPYDETRDYVRRVLWLYDGIVAFGAQSNGEVSLWSPAPWLKAANGGKSASNC
ncbi:MAG: lytic transglycosylase domain-containing protein [Alphaproteobacteria bacterium]|nr:lytic transglycosylase domain-containing protein [Alphaproteobacteria bacterium]